MMLYKKIEIPEFEIISEEILKLIQPQISQNLRFWEIVPFELYKGAPNLFRYMSNNFYKLPILVRFYNTPPFGTTSPHIDNVKDAKNKIGLNIPLHGTKNTSMDYYSNIEDNLYISHTEGKSHLPAQIIRDQTKIKLIDSLELDMPALVRTDVVHGVKNNNNTYRLIMGMKFIGNSFDEVYKGNLESL